MRWLMMTLFLGSFCLLPALARQEGGPPKDGFSGEFLIAGLKATQGCLGVETAATTSGKRVIFAWFEDKKAALRWYHGDVHQTAMAMLTDQAEEDRGPPLAHVDDDQGPILCIASLTPRKDGAEGVPGVHLPVSQIAIELYAPLPGGVAVGGRFAPDAVKVPHLRAYPLPGADG